jgi:hypothetical protein
VRPSKVDLEPREISSQEREFVNKRELLVAGLKNPAGETFKGAKMTKGKHLIPGKGIRQHDDFLVAGLKNPAGETFKGAKMTKGNFIPGKGIRQHDDLLVAGLKNPAGETFKGAKMTKGNFSPQEREFVNMTTFW